MSSFQDLRNKDNISDADISAILQILIYNKTDIKPLYTYNENLYQLHNTTATICRDVVFKYKIGCILVYYKQDENVDRNDFYDVIYKDAHELGYLVQKRNKLFIHE